MPNKAAKNRKRKKFLLNQKLNSEGRTANQHKKWLEKQKELSLVL
jgi:hypothetical protein